MEKNITEKEFLLACFGRNEMGEANVEASCTLVEYTGDPGNKEQMKDAKFFKEIISRFTKQGEFYFEARDGMVQIDFTFRSNTDPELRLFWEALKEYGKRLNASLMGESEKVPMLIFNVVPDKYITSYYLTFSNPIIWVLQPESPDNEGKFNILRMFFKSDSFNIEAIPEDIDVAKAQAETARAYNVKYTER